MEPPIRSLLKVPAGIRVSIEAHEKWMEVFRKAEQLVEDELELQHFASSDKRLSGRVLPPEVIGRQYARYCDLINKLYDSYLNSVQLQRAEYITEIISVFYKRMFELRNELVQMLINDYIYVDAALVQLKMTPFDIQIVLPYHFPLESRKDGMEQLLQKMWKAATRRKNKKDEPPEPVGRSKSMMAARSVSTHHERSMSQQDLDETEVRKEREKKSEEAFEDTPSPSVHTIVPEEFTNAVLIQKQERLRQWYLQDFKSQCAIRRVYYPVETPEAPVEMKMKAAKVIQRVYREFMKIKRKRVQDRKRDILIGLLPDPDRFGRLDFTEENNKVYEKRRQKRLKIKDTYLLDMKKEKERIVMFKRNGQIDDITEHINQWFKEWYHGYGFFPQYPHVDEGGTIMVIRGDYMTIDEKIAEDQRLALQKNTTPDQIKAEKARIKAEAKMKANAARENAKKEAIAAFKAQFNPFQDPGYKVQKTEDMNSLIDAIRNYRQAWSFYDNIPPKEFGEIVYGFMKPLLTEDLMVQLHKECRVFVDELMRLDLAVLIEAHKALFKSIDKKFPPIKPRKKPKKVPLPPAPLALTPQVLKSLEEIFDLDIITKPTAKLSDVLGDLNFAAYDYNIRDPDAKFYPPSYADVKRRLMLSCILACGVDAGAPKNKGVLLLGPASNGKSFLVDVVAGELNAIKIDITPEVFSAVSHNPVKALTRVFQAARVFQPTVIYLRNIERVFENKKLPENKYLKAGLLKPVLTKLVKQISKLDSIIFIATCSDPFNTIAKPMLSLFDEVILVPRVDHTSLFKFYSEKLQSQAIVPLDFPYGSLAQVSLGYGFGAIIRSYNKVMCPNRIVSMNVKPLSPGEFLEVLLVNETSMSAEDYQLYVDFYIKNSPLKTAREEFAIINMNRGIIYMKEAQKNAKKEAEKQGK